VTNVDVPGVSSEGEATHASGGDGTPVSRIIVRRSFGPRAVDHAHEPHRGRDTTDKHRVMRRSSPEAGGATGEFERVLSEHLDALYRTALQLCGGHRADAEDLMQETALRAFDGFAALRDSAAARTWLFRILIRMNLNRLRTRRRHPERVTSDMDEAEFEHALAAWQPAPAPDELAESARVRACVADALEDLDESLRAVVVLIDIEGFRQREAAEMLDIPEGTVASRLFRARCALRDALRRVRPSITAGGAR